MGCESDLKTVFTILCLWLDGVHIEGSCLMHPLWFSSHHDGKHLKVHPKANSSLHCVCHGILLRVINTVSAYSKHACSRQPAPWSLAIVKTFCAAVSSTSFSCSASCSAGPSYSLLISGSLYLSAMWVTLSSPCNGTFCLLRFGYCLLPMWKFSLFFLCSSLPSWDSFNIWDYCLFS